MFTFIKRIIALFKFTWLCTIVNKGIQSLAEAVNALEEIRKLVEGSPLGEKVLPYINALLNFVSSLKMALDSIALLVCDVAIVIPEAKTTKSTIDTLNKLSKELREISAA